MITYSQNTIKGRTMYQEYKVDGLSYHLFDEGPGVPYGLYREDADDFILLAKVPGEDAPALEQVEAYVLRGCALHAVHTDPARLH